MNGPAGATGATATRSARAQATAGAGESGSARRVAITGIGAVTPLGNDAPSTWRALAEGRSGVGPLRTFDASTFPVRIAGQVKDFDPRWAGGPRDRKHLSRAAQFGVAAAHEALRDAGAGWWETDPYERGAAVAGTVGRPELQELVDMSHLLESTGYAELYRQAPGDVLLRDQNVGAAAIAGAGDCRGPLISVSTACAGAAHAIGEAYRRIQEGECRMMLAGGFDALTTWMDVLGFTLLGAVTDRWNDDPERASRPFDAERSGFVLGEGAVIAVLEDFDTAVARGARIHAELVGYGSTLNAYRITDSPPDGGGAIAAMRDALAESGVVFDRTGAVAASPDDGAGPDGAGRDGTDPDGAGPHRTAPDDPTRPDSTGSGDSGPDGLALEDIGYVAAHGTGTPGNDISETRAIKEVFGRRAYEVAVSSPKSMTGHLTSAAAGVNLIAALGAIREGLVPPTINLDHPDPRLDLDYVPGRARRRPVRAALVNAFAFGGTNACLVIRSVDPPHGRYDHGDPYAAQLPDPYPHPAQDPRDPHHRDDPRAPHHGQEAAAT